MSWHHTMTRSSSAVDCRTMTSSRGSCPWSFACKAAVTRTCYHQTLGVKIFLSHMWPQMRIQGLRSSSLKLFLELLKLNFSSEYNSDSSRTNNDGSDLDGSWLLDTRPCASGPSASPCLARRSRKKRPSKDGCQAVSGCLLPK